MAAQQSAIRQMTQELGKQLNEDGSGEGNGLEDIAKEMEEIEKDIVNGEFDQLTLERQQDILTRLLKAENAERVRAKKKSANPEQPGTHREKCPPA